MGTNVFGSTGFVFTQISIADKECTIRLRFESITVTINLYVLDSLNTSLLKNNAGFVNATKGKNQQLAFVVVYTTSQVQLNVKCD